ncbi:Hpt domain-containing protein [Sphingobacterium oryzagri]|uniref:Hpt domain-containing protein n=1 Tax=Sphingobacterium oryzagri TaxID=3025669 RepID=A0ABY7WDK0_9SPHI|nr:Hpt domain-containing protein [Sphingobacterium sp. KACC 22765]WDF67731.1 Hpt domain-containing protein [Sphingobacterium sp. KACC 22765]
MTNAYSLIDPAAIQDNLMHNTDLIRQFLQLYQTQIPADFIALQQAMQRGVKQDISSRAHHIKPTMEYIGATTLRADLQKLETAAKENASLAELQELFASLETKFETLLREIDSFLSDL